MNFKLISQIIDSIILEKIRKTGGKIMKKVILVVPLILGLYACGDAAEENPPEKENVTQQAATEENEVVAGAEKTEWEIDERLQEPTEDTTCYMCNMKVYMRDHEQGVFSAQAIREDGELVFYDDIGCLLNDEYVNNVSNEKFVRDYTTLNWFDVEEAHVVKTDLKSPMNWGYIFFKNEEQANDYIAQNDGAALTELQQVREEAIERFKKKQEANKDGGHMEMEGHGQDDGHNHDDEGHSMDDSKE